MRFTNALAIAFATIGLVQASASAVTIDVSNLSNTPTGKTSFSPTDNVYMSSTFRTASFVGTSDPIQSITLRLQNESSVSITNAQVFLYSSTLSNIVSTRLPLAPIQNAVFTANIGATNPSGSGSLTYQDVQFNATASISLSPNTSYWVVFMSTPTDMVNWLNYNTNTNEVGVNASILPRAATSTTGVAGTWTGFNDVPNQFQITTVPEPSTYALAMLSIGMLGAYGRRKSARAKA